MILRFRSYFLRGLAVLLPTILTIWIFIWGYSFIQNNIGKHINHGTVVVLMSAERILNVESPTPRDQLIEFWVQGPGKISGFLLALVAVWIVGAILASVVGKTLWRTIEKFILSAPLFKQVYPYIKQITDFLLIEDRKAKLFNRIVAIEYPRKGIWTIGFATGAGLSQLAKQQKKEFLSVLIPTSPTPFTGFVVMIPRKEAIELDITIEQALRFIVSGGVITPSTPFESLKPAESSEPEDTQPEQ
jgi:uncharacterized membrane protein